jgi:hypothetical protein
VLTVVYASNRSHTNRYAVTGGLRMMSDEPNWKVIAGHLYDELRVRGISICVAHHANLCGCKFVDCIDQFERAEEING